MQHHRAGRIKQAVALYRRVLEKQPNHPGALHYLGLAAHQMGRHDEAAGLIGKAIAVNPRDPSAHVSFANALAVLGKLEEAAESCRSAISLDPNHAEAHLTLGNVLRAQGRLRGAASAYEKALSVRSGCVEARLNFGSVMKELGKSEAAIDAYRCVITDRPDMVDARFDLGNVLHDMGRVEGAVAAYRSALAIKPDYAEIHANLGNLLRERGDLDDAIGSYRRAVALAPGLAEAHVNLGLAYAERGLDVEALTSLRRGFDLKPNARHKQALGRFLRTARPAYHDDGLREVLLQALREAWVAPNQLAGAIVSVLRSDPDLVKLLDLLTTHLSDPDALLHDERFGKIASDPLFCLLLQSAVIADPVLERFLTVTRHALLNDTVVCGELGKAEGYLPFFSALAQQCFANEYVYAESAEEGQCIERLERALADRLAAGRLVPPARLVAFSCYRPLYALGLADKLQNAEWPSVVELLITRQLREPAIEAQLCNEIPRLTAIDDPISRVVQTQYETNPYPRWTRSAMTVQARPMPVVLQELFPHAQLDAPEKPEILIAGCGTGQHSIRTARRFLDARVLAIDLSLTSLAYALRNTREIGLDNIEYAQADILGLKDSPRLFDVIEAVGVLHHLGDPVAGWRVLTSLLRPGGLMLIGLYSELGRRHVTTARELIAKKDASTAADIRRCRQQLLALDSDHPAKAVVFETDFYSISNCRDLLFHVQEHRFTIPRIAELLQELELEFVGFVLQPRARAKYLSTFGRSAPLADLALWHQFEIEHSNVFSGMYVFWARRPG